MFMPALDKSASVSAVPNTHPLGGTVSEGYEQSPSPSDVGFNIVSRRGLIIGTAAVAGAGLLAACGSDDKDSGSTTPATDVQAQG